MRTASGAEIRVQVHGIDGRPVPPSRLLPGTFGQPEPGLLVDLSDADLSWVRQEGLDLSDADLSGTDLGGAWLHRSNLTRARLTGARCHGRQTHIGESNFYRADLRDSDFDHAFLANSHFGNADLSDASFRGATLSNSTFWRTDMRRSAMRGAALTSSRLDHADLRGTDLREANLGGSVFVHTKVEALDVSGANVYGTAMWDLEGEPLAQLDLVITPVVEPAVTVDDLEVAQFFYLLMNNQKLKGVIEAITSSVVLIVGRFSEDRKPTIDAIRDELRRRDCIPIVFDFGKPSTRGYGETVTLLARMARYVIADLTDAAEIRSELIQIVRDLPRLPIAPLIRAGAPVYETFRTDIAPYPWVLPVFEYTSDEHLLRHLDTEVVAAAEARWSQITGRAPTGPPVPAR